MYFAGDTTQPTTVGNQPSPGLRVTQGQRAKQVILGFSCCRGTVSYIPEPVAVLEGKKSHLFFLIIRGLSL